MKWRWFQQRMHLFIYSFDWGNFPTFPHQCWDTIYKSLIIRDKVISLSISALRLCYRRWDVWVSRKWSGKIFSPFSDGAHCVSCGELSVSQITAWSLVMMLRRWSISSWFSSGYWMMWNLIPWNWDLGENKSLHLSHRHNWLARPHNSFRLHSLTVIRIYKIVFSGFLWLCASKTNHHLATHWAHPTRYCCFSYHHEVRGKQRNHIFNHMKQWSNSWSSGSELEMDTTGKS